MNKYYTKILLLIGISLVAFSCSKGEKKVVASYDNGKPFIVEYYKKHKGKDTKTYELHYYSNGKIRLEGKFKNNKKSGVWKYYFEDGTLFAQTDYTQMQEGSLWQVYLNKDSLLVDKNDKLLAIAFSDEQTPVSIRVKRNEGEVFLRFFNSFKLMERVNLKGNIPHGQAMSWFEDGNLNSIHFYYDGHQDSTYVVYAQNGQRILSGQYNKGIKIGKWEYYNENGKPLGYEIYDTDGNKLSSIDNQGLKYHTSPNK